ncbi:hypothetical protein [Hymenobacter actinosclerus]|uniref:Uncharacterized protein n=1 Tax=Hymenobacter actinosclerus TaxID=82805 RepID=A0A1I0AVP5_9BACT|nr:hypothetical protein [Hymenobacter actinosclerus]SES97640.1 hypothetical protein SAMN04487998_0831 [Hymenobacter actinosclerus]
MKHLSNLLRKLTAVAAVGIALTSCNRAEYAMLPKTGASAYHGTQRATIIKPAPAAEVAVAPQVAPEAVAAPEVVAAPVAAPAAKPVAVAKAAPATAKAAPVTAATPAKAPKASFMQKALVQKIAKKADKLAAKAQLNKGSETAAANRLEGKLRQGVILLLAGLLIEVLGAITGIGIIYVLGAIVALIGVVLIILYLLDEI